MLKYTSRLLTTDLECSELKHFLVAIAVTLVFGCTAQSWIMTDKNEIIGIHIVHLSCVTVNT